MNILTDASYAYVTIMKFKLKIFFFHVDMGGVVMGVVKGSKAVLYVWYHFQDYSLFVSCTLMVNTKYY